jgi:hypothetical protein
MHKELQSCSDYKQLSLQAVTQFFFDAFDHDVVIIEETQELLCQPWYQYIRTALTQSGVVNDVPVIIITYSRA